jgi:hypothetical protein
MIPVGKDCTICDLKCYSWRKPYFPSEFNHLKIEEERVGVDIQGKIFLNLLNPKIIYTTRECDINDKACLMDDPSVARVISNERSRG